MASSRLSGRARCREAVTAWGDGVAYATKAFLLHLSEADAYILETAAHLHEVGMIRSSPNQIIADGTDWRFLDELRRELKA